MSSILATSDVSISESPPTIRAPLGSCTPPAPRPVVAKSATGKMVETFDAHVREILVKGLGIPSRVRSKEHIHIRIHRQHEQRLGWGAKRERERAQSKTLSDTGKPETGKSTIAHAQTYGYGYG